MTNKIEIGKTYKYKNTKSEFSDEVEVLKIKDDGTVLYLGKSFSGADAVYSCDKSVFFTVFEVKNALDKQFNKTSESVAVKEKVNEKEESIWKPISELPEFLYTPFVLIKFDSDVVILGKIDKIDGKKQFTDINGQHQYPLNIVKEYSLLTDFINHYEKLEERVKKLEEK